TLSLRYDYGTALDEFFTTVGLRRDRKPVEWSRRFFGRAYWNVGIVKEYTAKLPGYSERSLDVTIGVEPSYEGKGAVTPFTPATILRALPVFFRLQRLYSSFQRESAQFVKEFEEIDGRLLSLDCTSLTDDELAGKTREMIDLHYRTNRIA